MKKIIIFFTMIFCITAAGDIFPAEGKIAVITTNKIKFCDVVLSSFTKELKRSGYTGKIVELDVDDSKTAAALKSDTFDVVCTLGTEATHLAKKEASGTPIVFAFVLNPLASQVVTTFEPARGNISGVVLDISADMQLKTLKMILPSVSRLGIMYSEATSTFFDEAQISAQENGLALRSKLIKTSYQVPAALKELAGQIDALWLIPDTVVCTRESMSHILQKASEAKLPVFVFVPYLVKAGGLFCLTYDYTDMGKQLAGIVLRAVAGESLSDIPIENPRKTGFIINKEVGRIIGAQISPAILSEADELY